MIKLHALKSKLLSQCTNANRFINGIGERTHLEKPNASPPAQQNSVPADIPYLILDTRLKEDFDLCHIISAKSYPIAMLSRSINYETQDMLKFKNKPGQIIILYDNDESVASKAATILVQRGYQNIFMLSGGLKVCWKKFPRGLIIGQLPLELQLLLSGASLNSKKYLQNRDSLLSSRSVLPSSLSRSSTADSGFSARSSSTSRLSTYRKPRLRAEDFEPYCTIGSRHRPGMNNAEVFSMEDLAQLSVAMDNLNAGSRSNGATSRSPLTNRSTCSRFSASSSHSFLPFK